MLSMAQVCVNDQVCLYIIFYTLCVNDARVCHDFDPSSYLQAQGHSAHIPKIRVSHYRACHIVVHSLTAMTVVVCT